MYRYESPQWSEPLTRDNAFKRMISLHQMPSCRFSGTPRAGLVEPPVFGEFVQGWQDGEHVAEG